MTDIWRFIKSKTENPYYFTCLREVLSSSPRTMLFAQINTPHVSIGGMGNYSKMINVDYCKENNIPIVRSASTADASVFIDKNTIRCLVVADETIPFYEAAVASLKHLGLNVRHIPDTNNIVINNKKISVAIIYNYRTLVLFPWSVALDFNYDVAEKAIHSEKNMREWVTTAKMELGREVSVDELEDAVKRGFQETCGMSFVDEELTLQELSSVEALLSKYEDEIWIRTGRWSPVKDYWK